ncbi:hypothetical protein KSS87_023619 [Heliosperma pusillum]|nr:hypothetical protein KSS87_023619 [Heliosperma pusillum]
MNVEEEKLYMEISSLFLFLPMNFTTLTCGRSEMPMNITSLTCGTISYKFRIRGLSTMALQEKLSGDIGGLTKLRSMSLISLSYSDYLKFLRLESCDYKRFFFRLVDIAMLTLSKIRSSNGEYVLKLQYAFYNDGNKEDLEDVEVGGRSGGSNEHGHKYG